ncbi:MAG: SDR family NAD(P)-dependent oxidoreductase [Sphingomonadales bacterium]|jgi:short-subunit dehydrogenase
MTDRGVTWIVGGSTGIGHALALQLADEGEKLVVSARSADKLQALQDHSANIGTYRLDVTDEAAIHRAVDDIEAQFGPISRVIYAAAYWEPSKVSAISLAAFRPAYEVNLFGCVAVLEAVLPKMRARHFGHVALISSVAGYRGLPRAEAYGSSKSAMTYLAESMRLTLQSEGIKVQVITPGFVETPLTSKNDFPMPFLMKADEAARRISKGLKTKRFEITFPKRFTWFLKFLSLLPDPLYFALVGRATQPHRKS